MKKMVFAAAICAAIVAQAEVCIKDGDTIAFMGDSITQLGNHPTGYIDLVMKGLEIVGVKDAKKLPVGISGNKSIQMHARLNNDVLARKDGKTAQWMTFSCGVNDVWHGANGVPLEKYSELVSNIFDRCEAKGVKVIVLTPTLIGEDPENANNKKLDGYVAWIKAEAARRKLPVADLNGAMKAELARIRETDQSKGNKLTKDGVHMIFPGDCMMAWNILKAMGVDESEKDRIYSAWNDIPGPHHSNQSWSVNEWSKIKAKAEAAGKPVHEYIRGIILDSVK